MVAELSEADRAFLDGFTEEQRKKVMWKLDIRLVPMLAFLYLIAYLDRANIGNAKIEGLMEDLNLSGTQYNIALSIFFVPYIILEMPSNTLLLKFKRPSHYLGTLVTLWGVVMTLTGIVKNFGGLLACRLLLGVFESGFFPGAVFTISRWYLPNEVQVRIALFYSASALAGAFSGLLAFAIAKLDGVAGVESWRWIFILEGIASVVAGGLTFFLLIDTPELSMWLTPDEQKYLTLRQLAVQGNSMRVREAEKARKWEIVKSVLLDWQLYLQALVYWSNTVPNYGMKFTMPQIIKNMGYTSSKAQLLTIPPYVIGAISAFVSGVFSDRFKWRMPFIVGAQTLVLISFAVLFAKADDIANNIPVCYFSIILASIGFYPINPGGNAWTMNNLAGPTKRAQGIAYMICLGNIGGIIGSYIYIEDEKPKYPTGFGSSLGFAGLGVGACLLLEFLYWKINQNRSALTEEEIRAQYSDEELEKMGDRSPLYRYTL
ncbi:major facilitator superfamily domain-containing protein [Ilyonectria robusta]|uniref:major facilitator superfamily domain-containing protein n=1 Tax=Ilyonectria robusta TaxID=1079257 RepID=UPI001E8D58EB|nr:major facilitator superfamily domain-containing protein [Ilyonectria robusta]KAH8663793.1 major facilitator superfamily domain-containing protein [Ilyonectria robusta]